MLHFAYGSNMHRAVMRRHAPAAEPLGVATLADHKFMIIADGYASVVPARPQTVYGVLWRLTPRDRIRLDVWESLASGEYTVAVLPVLQSGARRRALVYVARSRRAGRPKAGYMELILAAAKEWQFPPPYMASLRRCLSAQPAGAGSRNLKEFRWT